MEVACTDKIAATLVDLRSLGHELTAAAGGRDPAKDRQIRAKITQLILLLYASTLGSSDPGVPAAILEVNTVVQMHLAEVLDAYWAAKGM